MSTRDQAADETRARILAMTIELLESGGVDSLTMRQVADRAKVSVSVVHHHFDGKQGLLDACKTDLYGKTLALIHDVMREAKDLPPRQTVELLIRDLFSFARVNRGAVRLLGRDIFSDGGLIAEHRSYERRPFYAVADNVIAPSLGLPVEIARTRLQAVSVILVRFAISTEEDLEGLLGYSGEAAIAAAEDHVVKMSDLLFFGGDAT